MSQASRTASLTLLIITATLLFSLGCSSEKPLEPASTDSVVELSKQAPEAVEPFEMADQEFISTGSSLDMLSRRALAIDDFGTLHAIYRQDVGAEQVLYYVSKPQGGEWSEPEVVGAAGTYAGTGWLEVRKETGEAYVVFFANHALTLGIRRAGGWELHTLDTPPEYGVGKPAMTIDAAGFAHIAMLVNYDTPSGFVVWQIAYGYWDGSSDFHFQMLERSYVPHHGLFAQPDIVVRENGSVVIAYHQLADGQFLIAVDENYELGGTEWGFENVDVKNVILYPETLEIDQFGYIHLAFHTNIELGAEHHVYYAVRIFERFGRAQMVSGSIPGARPRLALAPDGAPHLVFEEMLGPQATGRLVHACKERGKWIQNVITDNGTVNPSFVTDAQGNGNVLYERRVIQMENHDIGYYGYVAPLQ